MSAIKNYWLSHNTAGKKHPLSVSLVLCPTVVCADGFNMSVQASYAHYCKPRAYLHGGDYTAWEVGFPSEAEELLEPYASYNSDETMDVVFGYVPTEVVDQIIAKHGGLKDTIAA